MLKTSLKIAAILLTVGLIGWAALIGMVCVMEANVPPPTDYDALVVLGAQVRADGSLSLQLQWRLDAALAAYWEKQVLIICCGAQGADEPAPEGRVMRDYLIAQGVSPEDVIAETDSANTQQNVTNALRLLNERLGEGDHRVCIVTSDYHLPRALAISRDAGASVCGLPAATKPEYWLKNHAREALAWVKYLLLKWF